MKEKTSITLSKDLRERARAALRARDLKRINNAADRLNLRPRKSWITRRRGNDGKLGTSVTPGKLYRVYKPGGDAKQGRIFVAVKPSGVDRFEVLNGRLR
ncbi:MAG: hypothetical protein DMG49_09750, partial [Acidobacteria bacterium]